MGPDAGKAAGAASKIFRIVDQGSKIDAVAMDEAAEGAREKGVAGGRMVDMKVLRGRVEFRDVWFRYPTRKEEFVLRGLCIVIEPGESVALVGESGCGKSTFINLLMRFYDPEYGKVLLDGVDIREFNLHSLRQAISLVMQEPVVFNYSLLENILYGKADATNNEVYEAAEIANCLEFIEAGDLAQKKDDKASTLIGEMKANEAAIVAIHGQEKFDEEMRVLELAK